MGVGEAQKSKHNPGKGSSRLMAAPIVVESISGE